MADKITKTIELEVKTDLYRRSLNNAKIEYENTLKAIRTATDKETKNKFLDTAVKIKKLIKDAQDQFDKMDLSKIEEQARKVKEEFLKLYNTDFKRPKNLLEAVSMKGSILKEKAATLRSEGKDEEAEKVEGKIKRNAIAQDALKTAMKGVNVVTKFMKDQFKQLFADIKREFMDIIDQNTGAASYLSGSLFTNQAARETKLKYGLSSSQAYGFDQARALLNISTTNDEDLAYMPQQQREKLLQYMEHYSSWYEQMEQSGVLQNIQEMQLEFSQFKQEIAMEFLSWVAQNKEAIMGTIRGIFTVVKFIAEMIMNILSLFGQDKKYNLSTSDTYGGGPTTNNKSTVVNINANTNNTLNGAATNAVQQQQDIMWSDIAKKFITASE